MSLTPGRRLVSGRPALNTPASQPNLNLAASTSAASRQASRQASLQALTGQQPTTPKNKMGADGRDIEVGDAVDVPGGMNGVVKFVGSVRGKPGLFAGVELSREFAHRGKNDGDVEGTRYFRTSVPGAGIFLPVHRAVRRGGATSPMPASTSMMPPTPTTPSYSNNNFSFSTREKPNYAPDTTPIPKFSQSVGPGARAPSPSSKLTRPTLSRPDSRPASRNELSPVRKTSALTPSRNGSRTPSGFSKSAIGPPRFNSPAPKLPNLQKPRTPGPPSRPYSRNNSRLGQHSTIDEDLETTPTSVRISNDSLASMKQRRPDSNHSDDEVLRLTKLLEDREAQLKEQAKSLAEMEANLTEIQDLLPGMGAEFPPRPRSQDEPSDVAQLRALLREKTEKISLLTAEFDNHRADFRSTIDTLELASTETERVYERKVEELQEELRELYSRNEDVETVAIQLKQLEDLVHELEEGLEDARRGEAEARGEVEFLRGEVERGRSELRQEREKAAAALKGAGAIVDSPAGPGNKDVEQRDDEIRGLKAIIHSLSSGLDEHGRSPLSRQGSSGNPEELRTAQANNERLEREKEELRGLVERKAFREEELEREIESLKAQLSNTVSRESVVSNGMSEHTTTPEQRSSGRDSKSTIVSWRGSPIAKRRDPPQPVMASMAESDTQSSADDSALWCEICETGGHDILNCTAMGSGDALDRPLTSNGHEGDDTVIEGLRGLASDRPRPLGITPTKSSGSAPSAPLPPPNAASLPPPPPPASSLDASKLVPPKGSTVADPDKWCALCEGEGHDVTECPAEDAY